jgi:soluble lytic murein transglycosylase-like protein
VLELRQRAALWGVFLFGVAIALLAGSDPGAPQPAGESGFESGTALTTVGDASPPLDWPLARRVEAVAARHHLDPALVLAVIEVESGRDPAAVSAKGAVGLMQVMPETAAFLGFPDPADPMINLEAGCRYLAALLEGFGGDVELALAAYNAGPGAVRRWGTVPPYRETQDFVARVGASYRRLTGMDMRTTTRLATEWEGLPLF